MPDENPSLTDRIKDIREWIYILGLSFALGVSYTTIVTRIEDAEKRITTVESMQREERSMQQGKLEQISRDIADIKANAKGVETIIQILREQQRRDERRP